MLLSPTIRETCYQHFQNKLRLRNQVSNRIKIEKRRANRVFFTKGLIFLIIVYKSSFSLFIFLICIFFDLLYS